MTRDYTITVNPALVITPTLPSGTAGTNYQRTVTVTGGGVPYTSLTVTGFNGGTTGLTLSNIAVNPGAGTITINGNDMGEVLKALARARAVKGQPTCIVSLTHKGQGILKLLAKLGDVNFHGKPVPAKNLDEALAEIG